MEPILLNKIPIKGLEIHEILSFDESYYNKTDILELKGIQVDGIIKRNYNQEFQLLLKVKGSMLLPDAITLDPISHNFEFEIDEICNESNEEIKEYFEKKQNILDIMGILWENIVLEVPISITTCQNARENGHGWELKGKEIESIDPRLSPLRELLDKEKE